jgi:hypothetical protein
MRRKKMYYHGWFTFPLGQYQRIWEGNTDLSCWRDDCMWYRMEHWLDPAGTKINPGKLRTVCSTDRVNIHFEPCESILYDGEQIGKKKTTCMPHARTWGDIIRRRNATFATFRKPGIYDWDFPWQNEYWRISCLRGANVRRVRSPIRPCRLLHEIEIVYRPDSPDRPERRSLCRHRVQRADDDDSLTRIIVGGLDLNELPVLPTSRYSEGFYMPMGISVPPFHQKYRELQNAPPRCSPYYSFILDEHDRWIDHHSTAIDGPVLHRDEQNPDLVHVYVLSCERHSLVAHYVMEIPRDDIPAGQGPDETVPPVPR